MSQTTDIGIYTSARTIFIVLAVTSAFVFAPLAAVALGVGPAGVTAGTQEGLAAPGAPGGVINTTTEMRASSMSDSHDTTAADVSSGNAANGYNHQHTMKPLRNSDNTAASTSRTKADTSAVDLDSNLSTTPAPLGVNNKSDLGVGVESRMPGAAGR